MLQLEPKSIDYLLSIQILEDLLKQNLITAEEYKAIDRENQKSFKVAEKQGFNLIH